VPPYQSPVDPAGSTTTPFASITNWNILVSGSPIFPQNYMYDYDQFIQETSRTGAINGGESVGLTSGLISQTDFMSSYRFYTVNLARRLPLDDVAKSIQVQGYNNTGMAMDYMCFVSFQRKLTIDTRTGAVVP